MPEVPYRAAADRIWAMCPSPKTTIWDAHHMAGMRPRNGSPIVIQNCKLYGFWAAKNCVALFSSSLSPLRIGFSRRSRRFSHRRFKIGSGGPALIRNRPHPFVQGRKSTPQIRRNLTPCQAAGLRDANRIRLELAARVSLPYSPDAWSDP